MNERERIELLMKCYNLTPSQFADRSGIQRASVSHILSGRNKPSLEVMLKIYEAFPGVDMKWLMMGEGEAPVRRDMQQESFSVTDALSPVDDVAPRQALARAENTLFATVAEPQQSSVDASVSPRRPVVQQSREKGTSDSRPKRSQASRMAQMMPLQAGKKIKEVRIYYSDGTYETLIPENAG